MPNELVHSARQIERMIGVVRLLDLETILKHPQPTAIHTQREIVSPLAVDTAVVLNIQSSNDTDQFMSKL